MNAPSAAAQSGNVVIALSELNASGVNGTATFTDNGGTTTVLIAVKGATGSHPTYIHEGTCDSVVPTPSYPLVDVDAGGASETDVSVALSNLLAGKYALIIHNSAADLGTYLACGDIVAGAAPQGGSANPPTDTTPAPDTTGAQPFMLTIGASTSSGVGGTAALTADGDKTVVVIQLAGATGGHPATINSGSCKTRGSVVFPLADVGADGYSETTINAKLDDILAKRYAINIHKSSKEIDTYIACGNIRKPKSAAPAVGGGSPPEPTATAVATVADAPPATKAPTATAEPGIKTPATGVGFGASQPSSSNGWIALVAAIAATLLAGGLVARGRIRNH